MQKINLILVILLVIANGCSVLRKKATDDSGAAEGNFIERLIDNNLTGGNFFIHKADVRLISQDITETITAVVKFRKPDTLLISIRSFAGIEAARFYMTKDTILVNDRINRQLLYGKPSGFYKRYGFSIDMAGIVFGDFIGGINDFSGNYNCEESGAIEKNIYMERQRIRYIIDCSSKKATYAEAISFDTGQMIKFYYNNFRKSGKITYPGKIQIANEQIDAEIEIEIRRIDTKWSGKIDFVPGSGYELIEIL